MGLPIDLRRVQVAQETTWGTFVPATARLLEVMSAEFEANSELEREQSIGTLNPATSSEIVYIDGKITLERKSTVQDDCYFLDNMFGAATPSGAGPYVRDYAAPDGLYIPKPLSFEYGMAGALYKASGGLVTSYELTIEKRKPWMIKNEIAVKKVETLGSLAALTQRVPVVPYAHHTTMYVDAAGGTMGSTAAANTLLKAVLKLTPNIHMDDAVGDISPFDYTVARWDAELEITAVLNATSKALIDAVLGGDKAERQYRFKAQRAASAIAQVDFCGVIDGSGQKLFENVNNGTIGLKWKVLPQYNSTFGNWHKQQYTNSVAALP
ncbi:phage tail tube protein [Herpetosiphon geysericola]|uniref:Uncharacterized protein n=1 Tax=Herpetosiphon geysericola TaxID=70996 RepID=A0A0P6YLC5_9CHLR|nr:phage tail tube protein [Herpetosiphon geysericola]KPL90758.1 hypothetical protein SE18_05170 [Herpetosiphon geysericola]